MQSRNRSMCIMSACELFERVANTALDDFLYVWNARYDVLVECGALSLIQMHQYGNFIRSAYCEKHTFNIVMIVNFCFRR